MAAERRCSSLVADLCFQILEVEKVVDRPWGSAAWRIHPSLLLEQLGRSHLAVTVQAFAELQEGYYVSSPAKQAFAPLHHRVFLPFHLSCKRIGRTRLCSLGTARSCLRLRRRRLRMWSTRRSRSLLRGRIHRVRSWGAIAGCRSARRCRRGFFRRRGGPGCR